MKLLSRLAAGLALALAATVAAAQARPTKPVRIMVGASPGGGTAIIARVLAEKHAEVVKQPFVVENRPGASNTIAADITAKAPADGTTLLLATNTAQAIAPHLLKLAYDPIKDLAPVSLIIVVPNVIVMNTAIPASSVKELVALMKAKPDSFSFGSSGTGSTQHLAGEAFKLATGTVATHVPYKGSSQALADLVGGQIQLNFDTTSSAMSFMKSGKVKVLAVMTPKRSAELPDVPTLAEAGFPGVEMSTWYGLYTTAGTPRAVIDRLHAELARIVKLSDVQARLASLGGEIGALTTEQFAAFARTDYERAGKLIRDAKVKID
jgi:tripartite-type tricarboxylate transporter receptor subunit TctC